MGIVKFGTLLKDDQPYFGCVEKANEAKLGFGDTVPGMEFEWVEADNLLVGRDFACIGISWTKLNAQKLVLGQLTQIDGQYFMCRCLKVGTTDSEDSEWVNILKSCGDTTDIWGSRNDPFWGQEEHPFSPVFRMMGRREGRIHAYANRDAACSNFGFRPVLEPVKYAIDLDLYHAVHENVKLWFPFGPIECPIEGTLIECSDYDITIQTKQRLRLEEKQPYIYQDGDEIVINRAILTWMTKN